MNNMKWHEMQNLFIGYNEDEDFRVLICAFDVHEADEVLRGYSLDAHLEGEWKITETGPNMDDIHFDCDYVITGGQ